jgi:hypothetical protein
MASDDLQFRPDAVSADPKPPLCCASAVRVLTRTSSFGVSGRWLYTKAAIR